MDATIARMTDEHNWDTDGYIAPLDLLNRDAHKVSAQLERINKQRVFLQRRIEVRTTQ